MAHFSTTFHVKPDLTRGEIRLSIQVSEARVDEWWVSAPDDREVIAMEGAEGWRGEGALKIRFNKGTADVAVYDKQGHRTVIRAFPSAVKLLLIGQIEISPIVEVTGAASVVEATTDDTPVFIPSGVGKGAQEGSVKTTSKKSAGVDDALKALKAKKGKKK